jgi:hypothetical protein
MTQPDFRSELERLVDLYEALGGNWSPHGYTGLWNDALAGARTALATTFSPPEPPTDEEIEEWAEAATEVPLEEMDPDIHGWQRCFTKEEFCASIRAALERWGK